MYHHHTSAARTTRTEREFDCSVFFFCNFFFPSVENFFRTTRAQRNAYAAAGSGAGGTAPAWPACRTRRSPKKTRARAERGGRETRQVRNGGAAGGTRGTAILRIGKAAIALAAFSRGSSSSSSHTMPTRIRHVIDCRVTTTILLIRRATIGQRTSIWFVRFVDGKTGARRRAGAPRHCRLSLTSISGYHGPGILTALPLPPGRPSHADAPSARARRSAAYPFAPFSGFFFFFSLPFASIRERARA